MKFFKCLKCGALRTFAYITVPIGAEYKLHRIGVEDIRDSDHPCSDCCAYPVRMVKLNMMRHDE